KDDTAHNGFTDDAGGVTVGVAHPVPTGPFAGDPCAVQVTVFSPHPTFFSKLFGMTGNETTMAVATISANGNGCMYFLSPTENTTFDGPQLNGPGCSLYTNNPQFTTHGGTVNVAGYGYSQTISDNGTKYPLATPVKIPPVSDPCHAIPGCAALAKFNPPNAPPGTPPCTHPTNSAGIMNPGCYTNDFIVTSGNTTMNPGLYVITGTSPSMHGNLTGTGVTMYVGLNGTAPSPNGSTWTMTPPTSGPYKGVSFYQVPGNSNAQTFDGTAVYLDGLVYMPSVTGITYNGQQRTYMVLILGAGTYHGNKTTLTFVGPTPGQSLIQNAVLGE
ncbi:MAG: hypothetical protein ABI231_02085, partial [Candidatus Tumulicola sp.]